MESDDHLSSDTQEPSTSVSKFPGYDVVVNGYPVFMSYDGHGTIKIGNEIVYYEIIILTICMIYVKQ